MAETVVDRVELIRAAVQVNRVVSRDDAEVLFSRIDADAGRLAALDDQLSREIAAKVEAKARVAELEATLALKDAARPAAAEPVTDVAEVEAPPAPATGVDNEAAARRYSAAREDRRGRRRGALSLVPVPPDVQADR